MANVYGRRRSPFAIAVHGHVVYAEAFGFADLEQRFRPRRRRTAVRSWSRTGSSLSKSSTTRVRRSRRSEIESLVDARLDLRTHAGFFVTAVLILGVGIGASVAMFAVFRTVLV